LLCADDGTVLEGPTFSVGWMQDDVLRLPGLELGILDSITRRHVLDLVEVAGVTVESGRFLLDGLSTADEVFAMSTVKEVTPVISVGEWEFESGPVTARLRDLFRQHVNTSIRSN
jgi:branched-subunit amino acid aminotransferase/4-amino-4-deoxychorismate lyase